MNHQDTKAPSFTKILVLPLCLGAFVVFPFVTAKTGSPSLPKERDLLRPIALFA
jgi:hypothetical protein